MSPRTALKSGLAAASLAAGLAATSIIPAAAVTYENTAYHYRTKAACEKAWPAYNSSWSTVVKKNRCAKTGSMYSFQVMYYRQ